MATDKNSVVFYELLKAGLWEKEARLSQFGEIDYDAVMCLAEEQSVVGLVTAGLEQVKDVKVPQAWTLQFIGSTLQIEQRNNEMNNFIKAFIIQLRKHDIYAFLVKGQGVAQCYEKPLWRACGDIDLILDEDNYQKAKEYLIPLAESVETEDTYCQHIGLKIKGWIDKKLDLIQHDSLACGNARSWINGGVHVFLPGVDNDIMFIFTHFLKHFFKGGLGLRQICDWCRLLWVYKERIDVKKVEIMIRQMGLLSEWKAFSAYAVDYLGMPVDAMFLYSPDQKWKNKANRIQNFIMKCGNFGQNRETLSKNTPYLMKKFYSMRRRVRDMLLHTKVFPRDSIFFLLFVIIRGTCSAIRGI